MTSCTIVPIVMAMLAPVPVGPNPAEAGPAPSSDATDPEAEEPAAADDGEAPTLKADPFGDQAPASEAEAPVEAEAEIEAEAAPEPAPLTAAPPPTPAVIAPIPPPPPRPIRWRLDFGLGLGASLVQDPGYRAFASRRNLYDFGPSALFDFRLGQSRFFLGGGLTYQYARSISSAYDSQLATRLALHEPRVLGRASFVITEGIDAFALVGVGPSVVDLDLETAIGTEGIDYGYAVNTVRQRNVLPRVDGQAGVSLYLPKQWLPRKQASRITAGIDLSLGYTWRGTIEVRPSLDQGEDPLRATTSPLGELSLHGLRWGIGAFVRVM